MQWPQKNLRTEIAKKIKNQNSLANVDPPLAREDSLNETLVEKQKTPRGEWITCLGKKGRKKKFSKKHKKSF